MASPAEKNNPKTALVKLNGTIIKADGQEYKSDFFKFLDILPDDYSDVSYTPEEANRIRGHLMHLVTGASAAIPLVCGGIAKCPFQERCPFIRIDKEKKKVDPKAKPITPVGRQCHPPGEKILVYNGDSIPVEELDSEKDRLIGYERHHNCVRKGRGSRGYRFEKRVTHFHGDLRKFVVSPGCGYSATPEHICIARFNDKAEGKFCVYLMRKGQFWRIGKSKVLGTYSKDNRYGHKRFLGFVNRATTEKADALWILGVYDTNTEAMLAEDYFSCSLQTSQALFQETSENISKRKWNGLYAWATQDQIDAHHKSLAKPPCFYAEKLAELGLSLEFPIWTKDNNANSVDDAVSTKVRARHGFYIRACNVLSEIMDMPVYPTAPQVYGKDNSMLWIGDWQPVQVSRKYYRGPVYSLDVEKHGTYFVNQIATHNCLVEINLLNEWTRMFIREYEIDEHQFTEYMMVRELAEVELMLWRLNNNLAKPEHAELVQETTVGVDREGNPLVRLEVNSFLEAKERLQNRKTKLIKLMVGDRQEKYKREAALRMRSEEDPSSNAAQLRGNLDKLLREVNSLDIKVKEAEGKIIDAEVLPIGHEAEDDTLSPEDLIGKKE